MLREDERRRLLEAQRAERAAKFKHIPDPQLECADDLERWLFNEECDCFGQHSETGELVVRCTCQGCIDVDPDTSANPGHCVYCRCVDCVCPARRKTGRLDLYVTTPYWDNPCWGSCAECREHKVT